MKKILIIYGFFLFSMFDVSLFANNIELNNVIADFKQTIFKGKSKIDYEGNLTFCDDKNLWIYTSPIQKKVYISGKLITIVDDDLEQVTFENLKETINLQKILSSAKQLEKNHYMANWEDVDYDIFFNGKNEINIEYFDENKITLKIFNIKKNQKINKEIFKPKYPDFYDEL